MVKDGTRYDRMEAKMKKVLLVLGMVLLAKVSRAEMVTLGGVVSGVNLPIIVSTSLPTSPYQCNGVPISTSAAINSSTSIQLFVGDASRKYIECWTDISNTDTLRCDWNIAATSTSNIRVFPGSDWQPVNAVSTTTFNCIAVSGTLNIGCKSCD